MNSKKIVLTIMYISFICMAIYAVHTGGKIKKTPYVEKYPYSYNIGKKYPKELARVIDIKNEIKSNIEKEGVRQERIELEKGGFTINYYDNKGRIIYSITDKNVIDKDTHSHGQRGGTSRTYRREYPYEEGTVYDEKGMIKSRLIVNKQSNDLYPICRTQ